MGGAGGGGDSLLTRLDGSQPRLMGLSTVTPVVLGVSNPASASSASSSSSSPRRAAAKKAHKSALIDSYGASHHGEDDGATGLGGDVFHANSYGDLFATIPSQSHATKRPTNASRASFKTTASASTSTSTSIEGAVDASSSHANHSSSFVTDSTRGGFLSGSNIMAPALVSGSVSTDPALQRLVRESNPLYGDSRAEDSVGRKTAKEEARVVEAGSDHADDASSSSTTSSDAVPAVPALRLQLSNPPIPIDRPVSLSAVTPFPDARPSPPYQSAALLSQHAPHSLSTLPPAATPSFPTLPSSSDAPAASSRFAALAQALRPQPNPLIQRLLTMPVNHSTTSTSTSSPAGHLSPRKGSVVSSLDQSSPAALLLRRPSTVSGGRVGVSDRDVAYAYAAAAAAAGSSTSPDDLEADGSQQGGADAGQWRVVQQLMEDAVREGDVLDAPLWAEIVREQVKREEEKTRQWKEIARRNSMAAWPTSSTSSSTSFPTSTSTSSSSRAQVQSGRQGRRVGQQRVGVAQATAEAIADALESVVSAKEGQLTHEEEAALIGADVDAGSARRGGEDHEAEPSLFTSSSSSPSKPAASCAHLLFTGSSLTPALGVAVDARPAGLDGATLASTVESAAATARVLDMESRMLQRRHGAQLEQRRGSVLPAAGLDVWKLDVADRDSHGLMSVSEVLRSMVAPVEYTVDRYSRDGQGAHAIDFWVRRDERLVPPTLPRAARADAVDAKKVMVAPATVTQTQTSSTIDAGASSPISESSRGRGDLPTVGEDNVLALSPDKASTSPSTHDQTAKESAVFSYPIPESSSSVGASPAAPKTISASSVVSSAVPITVSLAPAPAPAPAPASYFIHAPALPPAPAPNEAFFALHKLPPPAAPRVTPQAVHGLFARANSVARRRSSTFEGGIATQQQSTAAPPSSTSSSASPDVPLTPSSLFSSIPSPSQFKPQTPKLTSLSSSSNGNTGLTRQSSTDLLAYARPLSSTNLRRAQSTATAATATPAAAVAGATLTTDSAKKASSAAAGVHSSSHLTAPPPPASPPASARQTDATGLRSPRQSQSVPSSSSSSSSSSASSATTADTGASFSSHSPEAPTPTRPYTALCSIPDAIPALKTDKLEDAITATTHTKPGAFAVVTDSKKLSRPISGYCHRGPRATSSQAAKVTYADVREAVELADLAERVARNHMPSVAAAVDLPPELRNGVSPEAAVAAVADVLREKHAQRNQAISIKARRPATATLRPTLLNGASSSSTFTGLSQGPTGFAARVEPPGKHIPGPDLASSDRPADRPYQGNEYAYENRGSEPLLTFKVIDPATCKQMVDPNTGIPLIDPVTRLPVLDPRTGRTVKRVVVPLKGGSLPAATDIVDPPNLNIIADKAKKARSRLDVGSAPSFASADRFPEPPRREDGRTQTALTLQQPFDKDTHGVAAWQFPSHPSQSERVVAAPKNSASFFLGSVSGGSHGTSVASFAPPTADMLRNRYAEIRRHALMRGVPADSLTANHGPKGITFTKSERTMGTKGPVIGPREEARRRGGVVTEAEELAIEVQRSRTARSMSVVEFRRSSIVGAEAIKVALEADGARAEAVNREKKWAKLAEKETEDRWRARLGFAPPVSQSSPTRDRNKSPTSSRQVSANEDAAASAVVTTTAQASASTSDSASRSSSPSPGPLTRTGSLIDHRRMTVTQMLGPDGRPTLPMTWTGRGTVDFASVGDAVGAGGGAAGAAVAALVHQNGLAPSHGHGQGNGHVSSSASSDHSMSAPSSSSVTLTTPASSTPKTSSSLPPRRKHRNYPVYASSGGGGIEEALLREAGLGEEDQDNALAWILEERSREIAADSAVEDTAKRVRESESHDGAIVAGHVGLGVDMLDAVDEGEVDVGVEARLMLYRASKSVSNKVAVGGAVTLSSTAPPLASTSSLSSPSHLSAESGALSPPSYAKAAEVASRLSLATAADMTALPPVSSTSFAATSAKTSHPLDTAKVGDDMTRPAPQLLSLDELPSPEDTNDVQVSTSYSDRSSGATTAGATTAGADGGEVGSGGAERLTIEGLFSVKLPSIAFHDADDEDATLAAEVKAHLYPHLSDPLPLPNSPSMPPSSLRPSLPAGPGVGVALLNGDIVDRSRGRRGSGATLSYREGATSTVSSGEANPTSRPSSPAPPQSVSGATQTTPAKSSSVTPSATPITTAVAATTTATSSSTGAAAGVGAPRPAAFFTSSHPQAAELDNTFHRLGSTISPLHSMPRASPGPLIMTLGTSAASASGTGSSSSSTALTTSSARPASPAPRAGGRALVTAPPSSSFSSSTVHAASSSLSSVTDASELTPAFVMYRRNSLTHIQQQAEARDRKMEQALLRADQHAKQDAERLAALVARETERSQAAAKRAKLLTVDQRRQVLWTTIIAAVRWLPSMQIVRHDPVEGAGPAAVAAGNALAAGSAGAIKASASAVIDAASAALNSAVQATASSTSGAAADASTYGTINPHDFFIGNKSISVTTNATASVAAASAQLRQQMSVTRPQAPPEAVALAQAHGNAPLYTLSPTSTGVMVGGAPVFKVMYEYRAKRIHAQQLAELRRRQRLLDAVANMDKLMQLRLLRKVRIIQRAFRQWRQRKIAKLKDRSADIIRSFLIESVKRPFLPVIVARYRATVLRIQRWWRRFRLVAIARRHFALELWFRALCEVWVKKRLVDYRDFLRFHNDNPKIVPNQRLVNAADRLYYYDRTRDFVSAAGDTNVEYPTGDADAVVPGTREYFTSGAGGGGGGATPGMMLGRAGRRSSVDTGGTPLLSEYRIAGSGLPVSLSMVLGLGKLSASLTSTSTSTSTAASLSSSSSSLLSPSGLMSPSSAIATAMETTAQIKNANKPAFGSKTRRKSVFDATAGYIPGLSGHGASPSPGMSGTLGGSGSGGGGPGGSGSAASAFESRWMSVNVQPLPPPRRPSFVIEVAADGGASPAVPSQAAAVAAAAIGATLLQRRPSVIAGGPAGGGGGGGGGGGARRPSSAFLTGLGSPPGDIPVRGRRGSMQQQQQQQQIDPALANLPSGSVSARRRSMSARRSSLNGESDGGPPFSDLTSPDASSNDPVQGGDQQQQQDTDANMARARERERRASITGARRGSFSLLLDPSGGVQSQTLAAIMERRGSQQRNAGEDLITSPMSPLTMRRRSSTGTSADTLAILGSPGSSVRRSSVERVSPAMGVRRTSSSGSGNMRSPSVQFSSYIPGSSSSGGDMSARRNSGMDSSKNPPGRRIAQPFVPITSPYVVRRGSLSDPSLQPTLLPSSSSASGTKEGGNRLMPPTDDSQPALRYLMPPYVGVPMPIRAAILAREYQRLQAGYAESVALRMRGLDTESREARMHPEWKTSKPWTLRHGKREGYRKRWYHFVCLTMAEEWIKRALEQIYGPPPKNYEEFYQYGAM